jgi:hypothetical protein
VGSGTTYCSLPGLLFECPYEDFLTPIGTTLRVCYWTEFGVVKHPIPCL